MSKKDEKQKAELIKFMNGRKLPRQVGMPERLNDLNWHWKLLSELGFRPKAKGDFFEITLPKDWKKEFASDEWFYIRDPFDRIRLAVFYKPLTKTQASAFINYVACYTIRTRVENGKVIATFGREGQILQQKEMDLISEEGHKKYKQEVNMTSNFLVKELDTWAKENYPDYENIGAYWSEHATYLMDKLRK